MLNKREPRVSNTQHQSTYSLDIPETSLYEVSQENDSDEGTLPVTRTEALEDPKKSDANSPIVKWLFGLRGLAAAFVASHHLGDVVLGFTKKNEERSFWSIPLEIGLRGVSVTIFFVLTGFALSLKYYRTQDRTKSKKDLMQSAKRRFFRLFFPAFAAGLLSYIFVARKLYEPGLELLKIQEEAKLPKKDLEWISGTNPGVFYKEKTDAETFTLFLRDMLFLNWTLGYYTPFNASFWMLSWEWIGSLLLLFSLKFVINLKPWNRRGIFLFACIVGIFPPSHEVKYLLALIAGSLLADLHVNAPFKHKSQGKFSEVFLPHILSTLGFLVAYYLLSVSDQSPMEDKRYKWLESFLSPFYMKATVHYIGSILLVLSIQYNLPLQKFFKSRVMVFLGRLTFGLYLLHFPIMHSLISLIYVQIQKWNVWGIYFTLLPVFFVVTGSLAYLFAVFVDEPVSRALRRYEKRSS